MYARAWDDAAAGVGSRASKHVSIHAHVCTHVRTHGCAHVCPRQFGSAGHKWPLAHIHNNMNGSQHR